MPEAVIVAAARSPIGRARKGSLADVRPDDMAAQMVRAALAQIPALDAGTVDDLQLGCAIPEGHQGAPMNATTVVQTAPSGDPDRRAFTRPAVGVGSPP